MRSRLKLASWMGWTLIAVAALAGAVFNVAIVEEYYGSGPPYYGRSANMDKWTTPIPMMIVINVALIAVASVGAAMLRTARRRREHRQ